MRKKIYFILLISFFQLVLADQKQAIQAHGVIMTVAWLLLASTGIVISRYCKHFGESTNKWVRLHVALVLPVPILSIVAFLAILGGLDWKWVSTDKPISISHSIFGIVAITFSVFQVIIGALHPNYNKLNYHSAKMMLFRYTHRFVGLFAMLCAIIAIHLALFQTIYYLTWIAIVCYTFWLFFLTFILEIVFHFNEYLDIVKNFILAFHVIFSMAACGVIISYISIYSKYPI